jgi:regulatory protein
MYMRRGKNERFIITLDDEQELVMTPEIVAKYGIVPQREFSDESFLKILEEDNTRQAKDQALRYLSRRQHSRLELFRKMRQKGYRAEIINHALDELEKIDLVNDEEFARLYILNELRMRPQGRILLFHKLSQRGISRELSESLVTKYLPEEKEPEMAHLLVKKYLHTHRTDSGDRLKEKLIRFLYNRGFTWDCIEQVLPYFEQNFR